MAGRTVTRELELDLNGRALRYQFHRVPRRRHVHLVVDDDGVLHVRAPYRSSAAQAEQVICEYERWVLAKLDATARRVARRPPLQPGAKLPFLDEQLTLRIGLERQLDLFDESGLAAPESVRRRGAELRVHLPRGAESRLRELLEGWYRAEAERILGRWTGELGRRLGLTANRIAVRAQKTCWGSCSARGNISLNWRLLLLPRALAEYVIVHELCHLRHLDHSPAFWQLVATLVPDHGLKRRALRQRQPELPL